MRERWNHPCAAIWDGSNETVTPETVKAIKAVRHLDLSNRPWDNGWSEPECSTDVAECHPYLFVRWVGWDGFKSFHLRELENTPATPEFAEWTPAEPKYGARHKKHVPVIINEYDFLWLNRDGSPTAATGKIYDSLLGPNSTIEQRRLSHARNVAALTEFWRCHREAAGVLHFCGLGYSRRNDKPAPEGGATSDDFIDVEKLILEPHFEEYVREAFNPVGLMLDFWKEEVAAGSRRQVKIYVINDLDRPWQGPVRLYFMRGDRELSAQTQTGTIPPLGREILTYAAAFPTEPGRYTLVAELPGEDGRPVRSLRDLTVK